MVERPMGDNTSKNFLEIVLGQKKKYERIIQKITKSGIIDKRKSMDWDDLEAIIRDVYKDEVTKYSDEIIFSVIELLNQENIIQYPKNKKKNFHYHGHKLVPNWVWRKNVNHSDLAKTAINVKLHPWSPKLNWVINTKINSKQTYDNLIEVDHFVKSKYYEKEEIVPEKERSILLFNDEKRLAVFRKRFINYADLFRICKAKRIDLGLQYNEYSSQENKILILENLNTYFSFCKINSKRTINKNHLYRYIVYGQGFDILDRVDEIVSNFIDGSIHYFGDIDITGIAIGQKLQKKLDNVQKLFTFKFATEYYTRLYELYLLHNKIIMDKKGQSDSYSLDFLPNEVKLGIKKILANEERIPQELLNIKEIDKIYKLIESN